MQEFCVKKKDRVEVICMIGVYGFLVTVVQVYPFDPFIVETRIAISFQIFY